MDYKYVYRDPNRPLSSVTIEVVAKNKHKFIVKTIAFYDKDNKRFCRSNGFDEMIILNDSDFFDLFVPAKHYDEGYIRSGYLRSTMCQIPEDYISSREHRIVDPKIDYYDLDEITFTMKTKSGFLNINENEETVHLIYDEDKQFQASKTMKERYRNGEACNAYEKNQIAYYFGILFYRDFDRWYEEITDYLSYLKEINDYEKTDIVDMLNYPILLDYESAKELQAIMNLNDVQFEKYGEVIQMANDMKLFDYQNLKNIENYTMYKVYEYYREKYE